MSDTNTNTGSITTTGEEGADDTVSVPMPERGRSTLSNQGRSLRDMINDDEPDGSDIVDALLDDFHDVEAEEDAPEATTQADPMLPREVILDEASEVNVATERNVGPAQAHLQRIADMWSVIFGHPVTRDKVALALSSVSIASLAANPNQRDQWAQAASHVALGAEAMER